MAEVTADSVRSYFASRRAGKDGEEAVKEGRGARRKAEFALALAAALREANDADREADDGFSLVSVPDHLEKLFDFLYPAAPDSPSDLSSEDAAMEPPGWLAPDNIWDRLPGVIDWGDDLDDPAYWPEDEPIDAEHEFEFEFDAAAGEVEETPNWDDPLRSHPIRQNHVAGRQPGSWPTQAIPGAWPEERDNA